MQNTRDHSEVSELRKAVGLSEKKTSGVSKLETNGTKPAVVIESPAAPTEPAASNPEPVAA